MSDDRRERITRMLERSTAGDAAAASELFPLLYDELRRLAAAVAAGRGERATLQPTAVVHEVYVRLAGDAPYHGREHFLAVAAKAMRHVLADHARARAAQKRGGALHRVTLDDALGADAKPELDLVALDDALGQLERIDARAARVAELRLLGGLSCAEIAPLVGVTERTVQFDWKAASAWLHRALGDRA